MEKKKKEKKGRKFKLPKRKQPVFNFFKKIFFGPIYRAKVESEIKVLPDKAVIASIHSAKSGPMSIAVSYPKFCAIWGHGAMLGSYRDRFKYLRNVLYIQKMHKNKFDFIYLLKIVAILTKKRYYKHWKIMIQGIQFYRR